MYKHIIFDIDGTLLNTEDTVFASLRRVGKELLHRDLSDDEIRKTLGVPGLKALEMVGVPQKECHSALKLWEKYFEEDIALVKHFPGIRELLEELTNRGYKLGIITSKNLKEFNTDFVPFGLLPYFGIIITADDSLTHKPDKGPMIEYMKRANIEPSEALYLGDAIYDYKCANSAGVDFILALWGCKDDSMIMCENKFVHPSEVLSYLEK